MVVRVGERQRLEASGVTLATRVGALRPVAIPCILRAKTSSSQAHTSTQQQGQPCQRQTSGTRAFVLAGAAELQQTKPLAHSLTTVSHATLSRMPTLTCSGRRVAHSCVEVVLVARRVLVRVLIARAPLLHTVPGEAIHVAAVLDDAENAVVLLELNVDLVARRRREDRVAVAKELRVE